VVNEPPCGWLHTSIGKLVRKLMSGESTACSAPPGSAVHFRPLLCEELSRRVTPSNALVLEMTQPVKSLAEITMTGMLRAIV
jgi:hypothetical protein